jgi:hypothetical protein
MIRVRQAVVLKCVLTEVVESDHAEEPCRYDAIRIDVVTADSDSRSFYSCD